MSFGITMRELEKRLAKVAAKGDDEIRFDCDANLDTQTIQEIDYVQRVVDEDGNEFICVTLVNP